MSNHKIPQHIAIICDGNRRWARSKGLQVFLGHKYAVENVVENLVDRAIERGISYLTFWVFSTENWQRDKKEVDFLLNLFRNFYDRQIQELDKKGVRVQAIGDISEFPQDIQERIAEGEQKTKQNKKIVVTLAMNYGGHDELLRAFQKMIGDIDAGKLDKDKIDGSVLSSYLDTSEMPDPDLIVRTSGEQRLSGFMSWQSEYSEFWFPEFSFPEFTPEKFDQAIEVFQNRQRRFGGG